MNNIRQLNHSTDRGQHHLSTLETLQGLTNPDVNLNIMDQLFCDMTILAVWRQ